MNSKGSLESANLGISWSVYVSCLAADASTAGAYAKQGGPQLLILVHLDGMFLIWSQGEFHDEV